ncbi:MAG: hypothetical protein AAFY98_03315, partial [Verrucomicrobiota bacterium]
EGNRTRFFSVRMDTWLRDDDDHLVQASLRIMPEEIRSVQFLAEAPTFVDVDGASVTMEAGFYPES